jgi:NDP-sugar pyrophosphorylase family protein
MEHISGAEIRRSVVGRGLKIPHGSYLGHSIVGSNESRGWFCDRGAKLQTRYDHTSRKTVGYMTPVVFGATVRIISGVQ